MKVPTEPLHRWEAPPLPAHLERRVRDALERVGPSSITRSPVWLLAAYGTVIALLLLSTGPRRSPIPGSDAPSVASIGSIRPVSVRALPEGLGAVVASRVDLHDYAANTNAVLKVERRQ